jgi:hypothetical protein
MWAFHGHFKKFEMPTCKFIQIMVPSTTQAKIAEFFTLSDGHGNPEILTLVPMLENNINTPSAPFLLNSPSPTPNLQETKSRPEI